jgi:hypothetical protein
MYFFIPLIPLADDRARGPGLHRAPAAGAFRLLEAAAPSNPKNS